jgi:tetratricopeptide (TPR) repeat protein
MKKIVISSLLLLSFSQSFGASIVDTQEYKDAVKLFKENKYKESKEIFYKLFEKNSSDPQINFYLGRSYFQLKQYEKALIAYDRVLIMQEDHNRTKLEMGRTYILLGMYKDAKKIFEEVLASKPPKNVEKNIKLYLENIKKYDTRSKNSFVLALSVGFDDNINSNAGADALKDYMVNSLGLDPDGVTTSDKISSGFAKEMFNARNSYDFGRKGGWSNETSLVVLNQNYKLSEYDLLYKNISTGPSYKGKGFSVSLPITYEHVHYAHNELLHSLYIQPKLTKSLTKDTLMNAYLKYQKKMYFAESSKGKNSYITEANISLMQNYKPNIFNLAYTVSREDKIEGDSKYVNRLTHLFSLSYMRKFSLFDFKTQVSYKKINYFDEYTTGINRDDKNYSYLISLTKKLNKKTSVNLTLNTTKNISNYTPVEYDKNSVTVNLNYIF